MCFIYLKRFKIWFGILRIIYYYLWRFYANLTLNVLKFVGVIVRSNSSLFVVLLDIYLFSFYPHNLQCNLNSMHTTALLQHLLSLGMRVCVCVFIGPIRRHPNFRKVINLPSYICSDILKEVGFSKLPYVFHLLDKHTLFTKGIGQPKLIY